MTLPRRAALGALASLAAPGLLRAQGTYPARPVRVIVPFPPGGATDAVGRLTAERLAAELGQPFVVENRGGAGGNIGAEAAARSEPDGYTLLIAVISVSAMAPHLYQRLSFDPVRDIIPVAQTCLVANGILARPDLPAKTLPELLALARARPGQLTYGSPGNGTSGHLTAEYLEIPGRAGHAARALPGHRAAHHGPGGGAARPLRRQPADLSAACAGGEAQAAGRHLRRALVRRA
ncbi:tripartite tricarboxylate transporter substrate binding protein [Siccirubricoccus sp. G192]|nr:tripartite tricarboxylate transporter substrate binding protein [Siccirubricoccus sp. G192]